MCCYCHNILVQFEDMPSGQDGKDSNPIAVLWKWSVEERTSWSEDVKQFHPQVFLIINLTCREICLLLWCMKYPPARFLPCMLCKQLNLPHGASRVLHWESTSSNDWQIHLSFKLLIFCFVQPTASTSTPPVENGVPETDSLRTISCGGWWILLHRHSSWFTERAGGIYSRRRSKMIPCVLQ